jgi:hypothetical protein
MLHIFIFVSTSLPPYLLISPSISQVKSYQVRLIDHNKNIFASDCPAVSTCMGIQAKMISMAMSNIDGFIPNHLLPQMYGTTVLHEDVELSDEELELIAGGSQVADSYSSDVFIDGRKIIDFRYDVQNYVERNDHQGLIDHIKNQLDQAQISYDFRVPGVLSDNLRAVAPRVIKGERGGFKINLNTAQVCYNDTQCPF